MAPAASATTTNNKQDGELRILCVDGVASAVSSRPRSSSTESELQRIEGSPTARLADYFDYIVGTSTSALVTTMLAAPNKDSRPLCTTKEIIDLYLQEGARIFRNDHKVVGDRHEGLLKQPGESRLKPVKN
jgi:patatin-like phospholipase/acyl hydrolase